MEKHRFVRTKLSASEIWKRRDYYKLFNFAVSDICKIYIELYPHSPVISRKNHYTSFVNNFRDVPVKTISTSDLSEWFHMIQLTQDLSERTLAQIKSQLNPLFKWLVQENLLQVNPLTAIKFRRNINPRRPRCLLTEKELQFLLSEAKKHYENILYPYLYTVIHTGARRSEVANLRWDDFDRVNGFLIFRETKNGSDRKIRISPNVGELLNSMPAVSNYIFTTNRKKSLGRSTIERLIVNFKKLSEFQKDWHLHDLRHSFAYNFLLKGGEMYQLQALLGHKSIQMTVDLYGNLKSHDIGKSSPYDF